jgi:urate oxidase
MGVKLGYNQYGKAETRVVRIYRDSDPHELVDYNVSVAHIGDFADVHLQGDNSKCLTTDATKNTVNAFAKEYGDAARQPETFGLALARHFVDDVEQITSCRVKIEMYPWVRLEQGGRPHPHAFRREGGYVRTVTATADAERDWIVSGVKDMVLLKTTDSEFFDFYTDRYTTLEPTHDRVMATAMTAQWWHAERPTDWQHSYDDALTTLSSVFAGHHSLALQQTLYAMGSELLEAQTGIGEIRLSLPNKHHFIVDLSPYGLENDHEVFHADDRPYGLIEGTVTREEAGDPGRAFDPGIGW